MAGNLELPLLDMSSSDRATAAESVRKACMDHGFFYLINHGLEDSLLQQVFSESRKFFSLSLDEKMKLARNKEHRGYTPLYAETLDPLSMYKGDLKESFYIGPASVSKSEINMNQWPSKEALRLWRTTMESYYEKVLTIGKNMVSLIALALNLEENYFEEALQAPMAFLRLLHYPGELAGSEYGNYGASAHSDYGMVTLLATDGVPGLQICRDKDRQPQFWEDVHHVKGALVVNIGDLMERWTNCLFRSTLHRVVAVGQERYSVAFFLEPNSDCLVECLESCCSQTIPPRFPPVRSGDYLQERLRITYSKE